MFKFPFLEVYNFPPETNELKLELLILIVPKNLC